MYDQYGNWHDVYWHDAYWHHMGGLFLLVILLAVIFGIMYFAQNASKSSMEGPKKEDSAMDTLKKRYAAGEINSEEFSQKKKLLES